MTTTQQRARNPWGWGWADRFPDAAGRQNLAKSLGQMLGFGGLSVREPAPLDTVRLEAPRIQAPPTLADLTRDTVADRVSHTYGKSYPDQLRGFMGDFGAAPDLVMRPRSEADVEAALAWASSVDAVIIPFGGGTSVVGGVEAAFERGCAGVVSLDLGGLNQVLEVDEVSRLARIQAGVLGPAMEAQLAQHGLTLRHFPQSFEFSTLGGWIATRAGGHFATVYTHIDDLVAGTRMLTPSGEYQTRCLPGSGAGPSPDRLVLGSEGTLGVITEAWMRVRPRPRFRSGATVHFSELPAAVDAVRAIAQAYLQPANCRLLDAREAMLNRVAFDRSHVVVLGFESADHACHAGLERALAIAREHGGRCPEGAVHRESGEKGRAKAADSWRSAFLDGPYLQSALIGLGVVVDTFETACTWAAFPALHAALVEGVRGTMKRVAGKGFLSCRFTHVYPDGPAPYYTFLCPGRPGEELAQWSAIKAAASEILLAHGASITHHHAVGRVHRPWYEQQRPDAFAAALGAAKQALDPTGIMNPGVLLPG